MVTNPLSLILQGANSLVKQIESGDLDGISPEITAMLKNMTPEQKKEFKKQFKKKMKDDDVTDAMKTIKEKMASIKDFSKKVSNGHN